MTFCKDDNNGDYENYYGGECTIGITGGVLDFLHCGHVLMLEYAKRHCNYLKVFVQVDPSLYREGKSQPVETIYERYVRLKGCKYVNEVIPYDSEEDLINILNTENYHVRFIGADHYGHPFTGDDIRVDTFHFNPRSHSFSSSDTRERVKTGRVIKKVPSIQKTEECAVPSYVTDTPDKVSMDRFNDWYKSMEAKERKQEEIKRIYKNGGGKK